MLLPFLSKSLAKDPRAGIVCSLSPKPAAEDTVEKDHGAWIPATTAPEDELHSTVQCQAHDSPHEQVPALQDFLQYVRNMYVRQGSFFPPAIWNVYQRDMTQRTNNKVEAYHRAFGETVQVRHPSLWTYIWHLKDQQARAEQQMTAAANGEAPPSRRRKWRQLEQRIVRLKNQLFNGNRHLKEYWSAVAHCICHFQ
ncbi:hypothetical protein ACOMHN_007686 [Nucella lapillus]